MGDGGQQEHFLLDRFQELGGTESFFFSSCLKLSNLQCYHNTGLVNVVWSVGCLPSMHGALAVISNTAYS